MIRYLVSHFAFTPKVLGAIVAAATTFVLAFDLLPPARAAAIGGLILALLGALKPSREEDACTTATSETPAGGPPEGDGPV